MHPGDAGKAVTGGKAGGPPGRPRVRQPQPGVWLGALARRQGLDATPGSNVPGGRTYVLGYRIKGDKSWKSQPAKLHDRPKLPPGGRNSSQVFETTALALEGKDKDKLSESELTALRYVKALVQVLGERTSQDAFRRGAVIVVEIQQHLRGDGDLEVDQLLAVKLRAAQLALRVGRDDLIRRGEQLYAAAQAYPDGHRRAGKRRAADEPHAVKHRNLSPAVFDENAAGAVSKTGDCHRDLGYLSQKQPISTFEAFARESELTGGASCCGEPAR